MATATRIYHINIEGVVHLVRAAHPNTALMHAVRGLSSVRVASQEDLVDALAEGVKVVNAKEEDASEGAPAQAEPKSEPLWPMPTPVTLKDPQQAPLPEPEGDRDDEDEESRPAQDGQVAGGVPQRQRIAAKYRCPMTGSTWSGRGLQPTWLRVALADGKRLADFEVVAQPA